MKKIIFVDFIKSFLLFCIAFTLLTLTAPICFLYALIRQLFFGKLKSMSIYFIEVALALDNAGNVMMQHLLNDLLLIKNEKTYLFGNKKERGSVQEPLTRQAKTSEGCNDRQQKKACQGKQRKP